MLLIWLKTLIGFLLMLNFSLPLAAILADDRLPEEPMLLLILNMTLADYVFGSSLFVIGMTDVLYGGVAPRALCTGLQYVILGAALTAKTANLLLAVDQYVGVVHSLHHQVIMHAWKGVMLAACWSPLPLMCAFGLVAYHLGLETRAEFNRRMFGAAIPDECRWAVTAEAALLTLEMLLLLLTSCSAALFVYTAVQGLKRERALAQRGEVDSTSLFSLRFKSFKRIVKIVLSLLVLDIVGSAFRLSSRWFPIQLAMQVAHLVRMFSLVVEGWTYGLSYPKVRTAVLVFLCRRPRRRVGARPTPEREQHNADGAADSADG